MNPLPAALYGGGVAMPTTAGAAALAATTTLQRERGVNADECGRMRGWGVCNQGSGWS